MVMIYGLIIALGLVLGACSDDGDNAAGLVRDQSISTRSGQTRYFDYYAPRSLEPKPAVVVIYHGGGGSAAGLQQDQAAQSHWLKIADDEGLLLLFPNGTNIQTGQTRGDSLNWNDCRIGPDTSTADDVGFSLALLDWAQSRFNADSRQIFLSGASNGGMMSMRMATEAAQRVTAFASFIASQPEPSECAQPQMAVPALILHGTADPLIPYAGGCIAGGDRGCVRSAGDTIALWRDLHPVDPAQTQSVTYLNRTSSDDSRASSRIYRDAQTQVRVQSITVHGGGHQIPSIEHRRNPALAQALGPQNADIEAVELAWEFFAQWRP